MQIYSGEVAGRGVESPGLPGVGARWGLGCLNSGKLFQPD